MYLHKNWKTQHNTHTLYNKAKSEEKLNQREIEMRNGVVERESDSERKMLHQFKPKYR